MKNITKQLELLHFPFNELDDSILELVAATKKALLGSYSPYSNFAVGAALRLDNGQIVLGANQENAAYPSGLCAERVALFHAGSNFPDNKIKMIAITLGNQIDQVPFPCGACLQVIAEYEDKQGDDLIDIVLVHPITNDVYVSKGLSNLLPFAFKKKHFIK